MLRRLAVLLLISAGIRLTAHAQGTPIRSSDGDTLRYSYTPLPPQAPEKKPFLRRVVDYFGESTTDKTFEKKIDFTFAGGPSYSKNTSFGIGLLAAGLYRLDRTDSITAPSDVSIFGNVSVSGFYALGVTGNNPESTYSEKRYLVEGRYLHEFLPHAYIGGLVSFEHTRGLKFSEPEYLRGEKLKYTATGVGAILEYDSRDFIPNPFRGIYVSFQETLFPKGLGNCGKTLWRSTFTADAYRQVWKGGILAADLYAVFNSDGTPWPMLARMGGGQRMRGYYQGRYTDNDMITVQVELRQRIWRRIGCAVWGGAGNVFPSLSRFDWSQTLPNYGAGFRWELKKRVNVRLDYGFGKKTSGFLLNINEAF